MNRSTSNDRENSITWATVQLKYFIEYSGEFCCFTIHYDAWKKFYEGLTRRVKKVDYPSGQASGYTADE